MPVRILVIDDDAVACEFLQEALSRAGYEVETFTSAKDALREDLAAFDLLMSDIRMPDIDGLQFLRQVREKWPELPVILMTAYGSLETTMEALRLGAWDYISKPFSPDQIRAMVKKVLEVRELQQRRMRGQPTSHQAPEFIGSSATMVDLYKQLARVADSAASVLIEGESGTGKELTARSLHQLSLRRVKPFVVVHCGAIPETLLESELFGYERGAFTGADRSHSGLIESAREGTIFLDEINSTTQHLQVKLLRVLQEQEFERVGDTQTVRVDTRVIAASNRDLLAAVEADRFREDLYWRLNVVPIEIPPLRMRREDIPELLHHFLHYYNEANDRYVAHVQREAQEALQDYHWPGNVRELQNYVERAVVMAEGDELTVDLLPGTVTGKERPRQGQIRGVDLETLVAEVVQQGLAAAGAEAEDLHARIVNRVERELIVQVLANCNRVQTKAALRLGINRNTLHKKLKEYEIDEAEDS